MEAVCGLSVASTVGHKLYSPECRLWQCGKNKATVARLAFRAALPRSSALVTPTLQFVRTRQSQCLSTSRRHQMKIKCQAAAEEATIDNSTVLVVGGGGLGMEVVRIFAKAGSWVTAYQRGEKFRKEIEELGAMLAIGDVLDIGAIEKTLKSNSFDAIVCTVGGGSKEPTVDKDGPINLITIAKKLGVRRFLLVSSIGAGDSVKAIDERTLEVLRIVLKAKEEAEEALRASGLRYTILRPGGLIPAPPTGKGILTEDPSVAGLISRADVASLIMKILFDKRAEEKTFSAFDCEKGMDNGPSQHTDNERGETRQSQKGYKGLLLPPTATLDNVKLASFS